jgi:DNA repair protein RadC
MDQETTQKQLILPHVDGAELAPAPLPVALAAPASVRRIQTYECRLKKSRVLRLADVAGIETISCSEQAARVGHQLCKDLPHEQVWIVLLNGKNEISGLVRAGEGGLHGCALTPMDVLRPAILHGASGIVLLHNHPSGDPTPSQSDVSLTRNLIDACRVVGIYLLDHVVVTKHAGRWESMRDRGAGFGDD